VGVSGGAYWCVVMKRGDVVFCRFVGRRFWGNGERLCGCRKSQGYGEECLCSSGIFVWGLRGGLGREVEVTQLGSVVDRN